MSDATLSILLLNYYIVKILLRNGHRMMETYTGLLVNGVQLHSYTPTHANTYDELIAPQCFSNCVPLFFCK